MMGDAWNPGQYEQFKAARARPYHDLLALVRPRAGWRAVDLGCGTGELTAILHRQLGAASTLGIDRSANMLAEAARYAQPGLEFRQGDLNDFREEEAFDLVFSNAALHWVPAHEELIPRLRRAVSSGGQMALQLPAMFEHPSHLLAAEVAEQPRFAAPLGGYVYRSSVLSPERYADLFDELGAREQVVRMQIYGTHLASREAVGDWLSGTLLTVYRERLSSDVYGDFEAEFRRGLVARLPDRKPFFFGYRRILAWAQF